MLDLGLFSGFSLACFLICIFSIIFIAFQKVEDKGYLAKLFFISLVLKFAFTLVYYNWLISTGGDGFAFSDDRNYDFYGWRVAQFWLEGRFYKGHSTGNIGFRYLTTYLYFIFGQNTLIVRALNSLATSIAVFFVYKTVRLYFDRSSAKRAALIMAFFPNAFYWSMNHFKDSISTLMTFIVVYLGLILILKKKLTLNQAIFLVLSMTTLYIFRYAIAVPLFIIIFIFFYISSIKKGIIYRFIIVPVIIILLLLGINKTTGKSPSDIIDTFQKKIERSKTKSVEAEQGVEATTAHIISFAAIRSYREIYKLPLAMSFVMIVPYPPIPKIFLVRLTNKIFLVCNFFYVCLLAYILVGWYYLFKHKKKETFLLYIIPLIFIGMISVVHLGVLRYRDTFIPFFAIFAAMGIEHKKDYRKFIYLFNSFILIIGPIGYWIIKAIQQK